MLYSELTLDQKLTVDGFMGTYRLAMKEVGTSLLLFQNVVDIANAAALAVIAQITDDIPNAQGINGAQPVPAIQVQSDIAALTAVIGMYNTDALRQQRILSGGI